jgi:hypothetical protein
MSFVASLLRMTGHCGKDCLGRGVWDRVIRRSGRAGEASKRGTQLANYMRCLAVVMLFGVPCLVTAAGDDGRPVTFAKDIAPIFQEKCQNCHRAGQMAPMSLVTSLLSKTALTSVDREPSYN